MMVRLTALFLLLQVFSSCQQQSQARLRSGESLSSLLNGVQACFPGYEIPFNTAVDDESLQSLFYISPTDTEAYIGFYSRAITSPDNLLVVKAKKGKLDAIVEGMQKRQEDIKRNFEGYLPDQYDKACDGRIVTKGNFAAFILLGDLQMDWKSQYQQAQEYFLSLFE